MPLFRIQDDDHPGWVLADDFSKAIKAWAAAVQEENRGELAEPILPRGIELIAEDTNIIINYGGWLKKYGKDLA